MRNIKHKTYGLLVYAWANPNSTCLFVLPTEKDAMAELKDCCKYLGSRSLPFTVNKSRKEVKLRNGAALLFKRPDQIKGLRVNSAAVDEYCGQQIATEVQTRLLCN